VGRLAATGWRWAWLARPRRLVHGRIRAGCTVADAAICRRPAGLDSNTTYNITKSLRNICHVMDATMLVALLQPAPETFEVGARPPAPGCPWLHRRGCGSPPCPAPGSARADAAPPPPPARADAALPPPFPPPPGSCLTT
jgi:hypothetical protein